MFITGYNDGNKTWDIYMTPFEASVIAALKPAPSIPADFKAFLAVRDDKHYIFADTFSAALDDLVSDIKGKHGGKKPNQRINPSIRQNLGKRQDLNAIPLV
jgi:hypothetical protein